MRAGETHCDEAEGTMFCRVSRIILFLLVIFNNSCNIVQSLLNKENEKLSENAELQMCIDSFDIYKDKIIRTQDSQGMGAKYLNEVDLDSRQECLRLCCETDECDVFIFEEKKPGSCYLFHCGRPHDFKCKFTSHANYSSAVLTNMNYRSTVQLEEQIRRTQQEHELKSLRKLSEPAPLEYVYTEAPPPIPITEAPKNVIPTTQLPVKPGCSRNQYECRTSGDCIAIYNVCDGIPQCPDGSDEASELGCPTEKPTMPSAPIIQHEPLSPQTSQILNKYPPLLPHRKIHPPIFTNEQESPPKMWQVPISPHQIIPQETNVQYPIQQGILPQTNYGSQGYIGGWDWRQMYEQNKEAYNSPNQLHPKNELVPYDQDQPRIFKHKSPGVVSQSAESEGNSYIDSNRPYESYYPPQNHGVWQDGPPQIPSRSPEPSVTPAPKMAQDRLAVSEEKPKNTTGTIACKPPPKHTSEPSTKEINVERKEQEVKKIIPVERTKDQDLSAKLNNNEKAPVTKTERKVVKPPDHEEQKKIHEERKTEVRKHHFVAEHLQQKNHKIENDILRPKGAVISLALGLTATAIMAALIACRLRVVRRRGRRGHGPYAHDADYLVNGMYL